MEVFGDFVGIHGSGNGVFARDSNVGFLKCIGEERDQASAVFSVFIDEDELVPTERWR